MQRPGLIQNLLSSPALHPLNDTTALNELLGRANPLWSLTQVKARVSAVVAETSDTKTFVLEPNRLWAGHVAGQHVGVEVEIAGARVRRTYTVSSAPGMPLSITVKRQAGGKVSNWLHDNISVGSVLTLDDASGEFVLPSPAPERMLMIAGGSGITPVMAMLRSLEMAGYAGEVVLVYGCRSADDVIFGEELAQMKFVRLHLHFSQAQGRLSPLRIGSLVPDWRERETFLCGPAGLMQAVRAQWKVQGFEQQLRSEAFTAAGLLSVEAYPSPYPLPQGEGNEMAVQAQVACAKSERVFETQGQVALLNEAEAAGMKPKHGCRVGICHMCKCKKVSGTVQNLLTGAVSSEPNEMIQLCVSAARSDVTLDL